MSRVANALQALDAYVEEWRPLRFSYGDSDCCQFLAGGILVLTGIDYRSEFPAYASQQEAEEILTSFGGMVELVTSVLGAPVHWSRAKRGDAIVADFGAGLAAGICVGFYCCAPGPNGLIFIRTSLATAAWTV